MCINISGLLSHWQYFTGNEEGEPIIAERQIRIMGNPVVGRQDDGGIRSVINFCIVHHSTQNNHLRMRQLLLHENFPI